MRLEFCCWRRLRRALKPPLPGAATTIVGIEGGWDGPASKGDMAGIRCAGRNARVAHVFGPRIHAAAVISTGGRAALCRICGGGITRRVAIGSTI
jgi:hypothetical protein